METNNPVFKLVVIVAALLALLYVAIQLSQHPISKEGKNAKELKKSVQIIPVDKTKLPNKFPEDLPIEPGVSVTQNFNATEVDGRYNATREFESKKSLEQNISIYTKYLKSHDWEIRSTIDQDALKMVMGKKGEQQLQIVAAVNPSSKTNTVTITLTDFKSAK